MNRRGSGARRVPVTVRKHFGARGARQRVEFAQLILLGRASQSDAHQERTFAAAWTFKQPPLHDRKTVAASFAHSVVVTADSAPSSSLAGKRMARAGTTVEIACL